MRLFYFIGVGIVGLVALCTVALWAGIVWGLFAFSRDVIYSNLVHWWVATYAAGY